LETGLFSARFGAGRADLAMVAPWRLSTRNIKDDTKAGQTPEILPAGVPLGPIQARRSAQRTVDWSVFFFFEESL